MSNEEDPGQNGFEVREQVFVIRCGGIVQGEIFALTNGYGIIKEHVSVRRSGQEATIHSSYVDNVGAGAVDAVRLDERFAYFQVSTWLPVFGPCADGYRYDWQSGELFKASD